MEHILRRAGRSGDTEHRWEVGVEDGRIQEAEKHFNEMLSKGGLAWRFDMEPHQGEQMDKFDPNAKEIVCFPKIAGG